MEKQKNKSLLSYLLKNKKRIRDVYLLGVFGGLVSCGGGGGGGGGGSSSGGGSGDLELTSSDDKRDYSGKEESYVLDGMEGRDSIKTGGESDVLRGGLDKDDLNAGGGDDLILLVGETGENEYSQDDVEDVLNAILGEDSLNNREQTEAVEGEVIDGGAGKDTLVIYGKVDIREVIVRNVESVRLHSELILNERQFERV